MTNLPSIGRFYGLARGPSAQTLVASIAIQTLLAVSGIIASRALGVEGRGTLAFLWLLPLMLVSFGGLGIPLATTYYVARDLKNARAVVLISVKLTLGIAALLTAAYASLLLVFTPVEGFSTVDASLSVALVPALLALYVGNAVLQGSSRFKAFNAARISAPLLYAVSAATLFGLDKADLTSILAAAVASWIAAAVMTWFLVLRHPPHTPEGR